MKGILTVDPTNQKFWLVVVVTTEGHAFGAKLEKGVAALLQKIQGQGDIAVSVDVDGNIAVGNHIIGRLVGWNGQPTSADQEAAWTLTTASGRPGRLGRAIQRAVRDGTLDRTQAVAWVRRYLGDAAVKELEELLEDSSTSSEEEELLEVLKQHLLKEDHGEEEEEDNLPPW